MKFSRFALSAICAATLFSGAIVATSPMQSQAANETFQNSVIDSLINPLLLEIRKQKAIIEDADYISQQYLVYKDQRRLAGQAQGHDAALVASRNELLDKLSEFELLVTSRYLDLSDYSKSVNRVGEKFFVIGTVAKNSLGPGKATIENQRSFMLDLILPLYTPDQQSLDYAFVAYGTKQSSSLLLSEQLLYLPLHKDEFEQVVASYHGSLPDIAAHVYFGRIIPGLKYSEQFAKINADMAHHKDFLLGIENFAEWMQYKKCQICKNRIVGSQCLTPNCPGVAQPSCSKCGAELSNGVCPKCPRCSTCNAKLDNGVCPKCPRCSTCNAKLDNGVCPKCPHCSTCNAKLVNGVCPNGPHCSTCNAKLVNGECPKCPPEKSLVFVIACIVGAVVVVVIIGMGIVAVIKPKPTCPSCGSKLENGKCPNPSCPSKPGPRCPVCNSRLDGKGNCPMGHDFPRCPSCRTPLDKDGNCPMGHDFPRCPSCRTPLDKDGNCPNGCTMPPPRPCELKNYDADATSVPTKFALKVMEPAGWAGYIIDNLPRRFEVGRDVKKTPEGTPFLQLNLKTPEGNDRPGANRCSRRYIRITETETGDGFNIDLLAETGNECAVNDKILRNKGECATAYPGNTIRLNPDWVFEVFDSTAKKGIKQ